MAEISYQLIYFESASSNLSNIPPLIIGNHDNLSMINDMENMKETLKKVLKNQEIMADLMSDQIKEIATVKEKQKEPMLLVPLLQSSPIAIKQQNEGPVTAKEVDTADKGLKETKQTPSSPSLYITRSKAWAHPTNTHVP